MSLIVYFWGLRVGRIWVVIAYLQQFTLEVVSYIEHYGLRRKEISPGKYERTTIMHSWNAA